MAAVDAMDAEGGTALTAPQLLSDACNHCVVVVDTLETNGFSTLFALRARNTSRRTQRLSALQHAHSDLKRDPAFCRERCRRYEKANREFVLKALREKFAALVDAPEKLWCDHRLCDVAGHDIAVVTSLGI